MRYTLDQGGRQDKAVFMALLGAFAFGGAFASDVVAGDESAWWVWVLGGVGGMFAGCIALVAGHKAWRWVRHDRFEAAAVRKRAAERAVERDAGKRERQARHDAARGKKGQRKSKRRRYR